MAASGPSAAMLEHGCRHCVTSRCQSMRTPLCWLPRRRKTQDNRMGSCSCSLPLPLARQVRSPLPYIITSKCPIVDMPDISFWPGLCAAASYVRASIRAACQGCCWGGTMPGAQRRQEHGRGREVRWRFLGPELGQHMRRPQPCSGGGTPNAVGDSLPAGRAA